MPSLEEIKLAETDHGLVDRIRRAARSLGKTDADADLTITRIVGVSITLAGQATSLATLYAYQWGQAMQNLRGTGPSPRVPSRKAVEAELDDVGTHPARVTDEAILAAVRAVLT